MNLYQLKGVVGLVLDKPDTQPNSNYKRLTRIFELCSFSRLWLDILGFVFKLISLPGVYLVLDGTSWKRGTKVYHYLTLALVYQGVTMLIYWLYWLNLHKLGVSSKQEGIKLMEKDLRCFDLAGKTGASQTDFLMPFFEEREGVRWLKRKI